MIRVDEDIIDEWNNILRSGDLKVDIKLKEIIKRYLKKREKEVSELKNPITRMMKSDRLDRINCAIERENWLISRPYRLTKEIHIFTDEKKEYLKNQAYNFESLLVELDIIDDIKKAYFRYYNRTYKTDKDLMDYIDKIFLKAYYAQYKRCYVKKIGNGIYGLKENTIIELYREIEERDKE